MPRLDVVVAKCLSIVVHVVHHLCRNVLVSVAHDVVRPVARRLPLQDVAVVNKQQAVAILPAQTVDIRVDAGERALQRLSLDEIIREEVPVDVACLDDSQADGLVFLCHN